jgi:aryl-alcohol dehydrogenase-like predicted oxidoreductase
MLYVNFNGAGSSASRIVLGTDSLRSHVLTSHRRYLALLDEAFDCGINAFDTAHAYTSQPILGYWAHVRQRRSKITLITKGGFPGRPTPGRLRRQCHRSLRQLRTDHVELYLLHYDYPSADLEDLVETLDTLRCEGKILSFGLSNFSLQRARQAHGVCVRRGWAPAQVVSAHCGLIEWEAPYWSGAQTLAGPRKRPERLWYESNGYSILAYSPLGRGYFKHRTALHLGPVRDPIAANEERYRRACELALAKGVSASQIALAYLLSHAPNVLAVIGCRDADHLRANAAAANIRLNGTECSWLDLRYGRGHVKEHCLC